MKRSIAILVSAAVTAAILLAVLAVGASRPDSSAAEAQAASSSGSNDPAVLQQQLQEAYTLLQQRDAEYQQRLQEAYTQLQAAQSQPGEPEHDDEHQGDEHEFYGQVEAMAGDVWTVAGRGIVIMPQTKIEGRVGVGSVVKVKGRVQADGTLLAYEIESD